MGMVWGKAAAKAFFTVLDKLLPPFVPAKAARKPGGGPCRRKGRGASPFLSPANHQTVYYISPGEDNCFFKARRARELSREESGPAGPAPDSAPVWPAAHPAHIPPFPRTALPTLPSAGGLPSAFCGFPGGGAVLRPAGKPSLPSRGSLGRKVPGAARP